ncbi:hypothetical protein ASPBRDRAFT_53128 [Aspergillus brasiliensis CBS 101740]|uniref:Uncharacterized protein n=1 Tax=Aspergillus brasiliensis (strain CBS 101740 / IMI 381727 / IBT 21946) TaxID=767769 RepID=A0A1L9UTW0_ASPBC|nr:hypothetical protein ASPBRDRAFT_53128 [Aspergillus brasiliensis CBS 101740]
MAPNALSLESLSDGRSMGRHCGVLRTSLLEYSAFWTWLGRTRQCPSYGTVDSARLAPPRRGINSHMEKPGWFSQSGLDGVEECLATSFRMMRLGHDRAGVDDTGGGT